MSQKITKTEWTQRIWKLWKSTCHKTVLAYRA